MVALCMALGTNAKILRVSNVSGSSAPYNQITDAAAAAVDGDTIMVDGSDTKYKDVTIDKQLTLIGPGYFLVEDGILQEGASAAVLDYITITKEKVCVKGMKTTYDIRVNTNQVVITRCDVRTISITSGASNTIVHQNYIRSNVGGGSSTANRSYYTQVTNNIIFGDVNHMANAYIANNTFPQKKSSATDLFFNYMDNCTIENNILPKQGVTNSNNTHTFVNNYEYAPSTDKTTYESQKSPYTDTTTDKAICDKERSFANGKYGACAGESPYVVAGVPTGPVIQDLTVPATVEQGKNLNVTIKLGMSE